jgi:enoyl-ACP reductase-like protein
MIVASANAAAPFARGAVTQKAGVQPSIVVNNAGITRDAKIIPLIPVGRLGQPEEIARAVVFLAADEAGFVTGACFDINGGHYMAP